MAKTKEEEKLDIDNQLKFGVIGLTKEVEEFAYKPSTPLIYKALIDCTKDIGLTGINKDETNNFQHFNYRSIDGCLSAFNKVFAKNGVCTTQETKNTNFENLGKDARGVTIWGVTFDLVVTFYAEDGSNLASSISIANDSKDRSKLMGQATSYALKELLFKQFIAPIHGADDIDSRDEDGRPATVLPKSLTNKSGIVWEKPDLNQGVSTTMEWASRMTGKSMSEIESILANTKPDKNGKKGTVFLDQIEMIWSSN
jgi:hypothetical protein